MNKSEEVDALYKAADDIFKLAIADRNVVLPEREQLMITSNIIMKIADRIRGGYDLTAVLKTALMDIDGAEKTAFRVSE